MFRFSSKLFALFIAQAASAYDATSNITRALTVGHWKIVEIAAPTQIMYRLASESTNEKNTTLAFDFLPASDCAPTAAVMIVHLKTYSPVFDGRVTLLAYKAPGQSDSMELTKSTMQKGDTFAFFVFERLTASMLTKSGDEGNLAIWIPPSGDGKIRRSPNSYFPLDGFSQAAFKAEKSCKDNR